MEDGTRLRLSHFHGDQSQPLIEATIGAAFRAVVRRHGKKVALVVRHQGVRLTYRDLESRVNEFAAGLLRAGLQPGDRIGIWAPNCVEWTVTQYAAATLGLILVNLNPAYRAAEIKYALNKAGCRALVLADQFKASDYIQMLRTLAPELASSVPGQLKAERLPNLEIVIQLGSESLRGVFRFDEIRTLGKDVDRQRLVDAPARLGRYD